MTEGEKPDEEISPDQPFISPEERAQAELSITNKGRRLIASAGRHPEVQNQIWEETVKAATDRVKRKREIAELNKQVEDPPRPPTSED